MVQSCLCYRLIDHACVVLFVDFPFCSTDLCFCFVLLLYCLDYHNFAVQSEVRELDSFNSIFLSQDCFGFFEVFCFLHTDFKIFCSSSMKNAIGNFIGTALYLQVVLSNTVILTTLILPIHEHSQFFHLFVLSSISFINVLQFSESKSQIYSQVIYSF